MMINASVFFLQIVPAVLSCVGSGFVVLTYTIFKDFRQLRYIELVFYISLNDLLGSVGLALGATEDYSIACWYQGISTNLNFLSSIFWTVVITYQVWLVVHRGSVIKDLTYLHIICWGIPIIVSFVPLSTNYYGNKDDDPSWCVIKNLDTSPTWALLVWELLAFYLWLWLALLISCLLLISILIRLREMQVIPETIKSTLKKLVLYPIAIMICWSFLTIETMYLRAGGEHTQFWTNFGNIGATLAVFQGFLFAMIFLVMNPLVRQRWNMVFKQASNKAIKRLNNRSEELNPDFSRRLWEVQHLLIEAEVDYISSNTSNTITPANRDLLSGFNADNSQLPHHRESLWSSVQNMNNNSIFQHSVSTRSSVSSNDNVSRITASGYLESEGRRSVFSNLFSYSSKKYSEDLYEKLNTSEPPVANLAEA